ncbi:MAG: pre-peptidase C-terminal domain-containing protein [Bacteroidales bacterium]|nr:pre-peptidase C-terminal domain-containing protein [Bacteroidales bacterium]MCM1414663.1 pre-peptidase C-terminal domain-containing protein [bacterium]
MQRRKQVLSVALVCSMLFGIPVMAAEENIENDQGVEAVSVEWLRSVDAEKAEPKYLSPEQMEELSANDGIDLQVTVPDDFEPNNTYQTAYPYDQVPILQNTLTSKYDLYYLGMRSAGLHSASDEDWYTINLTAEETYFLDIRNVGNTDWYIELYNLAPDKLYYYTTNPAEEPIYSKKSEKYLYFTAKDTGTYHIRVANGGDWSNQMYYFFYVGPAVQEFDIVDMPTYGSVNIYDRDYKTYTCDLRGVAVPEYSSIVNMNITDTFPKGKVCNEVEKYMSASGKTYYNRSGGGSGIINGINGAPLGDLWTFGGRCAKGSHDTTWSGVLNGRVVCLMAPYPGNEL